MVANIFNDFFTSFGKDLKEETGKQETDRLKWISTVNSKEPNDQNFILLPVNMKKLWNGENTSLGNEHRPKNI